MKIIILILSTLFSQKVFAEVIINGYCDFPKATILYLKLKIT